MYGIVNKAIEELVIENFGLQKWDEIKVNCNLDIDFFISNEPYDDRVTYDLAMAVSEVMNISLQDVFKTFGEWWILRTCKDNYGHLLESGGDNFKEFMINLPHFHNRVMMIYPKLTPPEFQVSEIQSNSLYLHYLSKREGLQDFVHGLITGLGKFYGTPVDLKLIQSRNDGDHHEVFNVSWKN